MLQRWEKRMDSEKLRVLKSVHEANFDYDYGDGRNLKPGERHHDKIVEEVLDCAERAYDLTDQARAEWKKMDWTLTAYVPLDENEQAIKAKDSRKPVSTVIPATFAVRETILTYMASAFLSGPVIYEYEGKGSKENRVAAALLERVIGTQNMWFKEGLRLMTQWRDAVTYGFGIVSPYWDRHTVKQPVDESVDDIVQMLLEMDGVTDFKSGDVVRLLEQKTIYEGSRLRNWDPYFTFLDPNCEIDDIQKAEFCGYGFIDTAMNMLRDEAQGDDGIINAKYVELVANKGHGFSRFMECDESGRGSRQNTYRDDSWRGEKTRTVHRVRIYKDIIPRELGLSDVTEPEIWCFEVSADCILTKCEPVRYMHGMKPVAVAAPTTSGHDTVPVSHLAMMYPIQEYMDFLIRSHVANVRKALNDMFIFDPTKIEEEDILNPEPGKLIRMKSSAYGNQSIDQMVKQFNVVDVTQNHLGHTGLFMEWVQRIMGTEDIAMGDLSNMPERPTARGITAAQTGGLSRLQRMAAMMGMQSMQDLGFMHAYNTLQYMEEDVAVSITGRYEKELERMFGGQDAWVSFWQLNPHFDVKPRHGAMPNLDDVQAMSQVMTALMGVEGVPQTIFQGLDVNRFFLAWAEKTGFKNVQDFIRETGGGMEMNTMPDEQLQEQVQAGNAIPMEEALNVA